MSLKSIRESYSNLLNVFETAGVSLNESQKADLDTFVLALESKMGEQRRAAIRQTKAAVEKKMEREYRQVFEGVMAGMRENAELAAKIQDKITSINESKKIAAKVNDYLDLYVESVLPKKSIVDYDRMQKLEKLHESLKDVLMVSDDTVDAKIKQLERQYKIKESKCETEVAKMRVKLDESMKKACAMKRQLDKSKARDLLESKLASLPSYEARRVRRALSEASEVEIERKFDRVVESVRRHINEETAESAKDTETTLESEIKEIIDCDVKEDDMLKNRHHNGHKSVSEAELSQDDYDEIAGITGNIYRSECNRGDKIRHTALSKQAQDQRELARAQNPEDFTVKENDEDFETMESVRMTAEGDVELDESDVIDSRLMAMWSARSVCID